MLLLLVGSYQLVFDRHLQVVALLVDVVLILSIGFLELILIRDLVVVVVDLETLA